MGEETEGESRCAVSRFVRVNPRTQALADRALTSKYDRGRISFDGPRLCGGTKRDPKTGKLNRCHVDGHAKLCRGCKTYWYVGRISSIIPAFEILGSGDTPEKALACAVRRKSQESAKYRAIERAKIGGAP